MIFNRQDLKINQILKILSLVIVSIFLVNIKTDPINAAANDSKNTEAKADRPLGDRRLLEDTPLFESNNFKMAFVSSLLITGMGILIGKGKPLKYQNKSNSTPKQLNKSIFEKSDKFKSDSQEIEEGISLLNLSKIWPQQDCTAEYKKIYQYLQKVVLDRFGPDKEAFWLPDVWEIDIEIAIMILSDFPDSKDRVEKVLWHSDQLLKWHKTLPLTESVSKTNEYIEAAYNWAKDLQQWRREKIDTLEQSVEV